MKKISLYYAADEICRTYTNIDWQLKCFREFDIVMRSKLRPFPCLRGVMGHEENHLRFAFLEKINASVLAKTLSAYLRSARSFGQYTSLVVFEQPGTIHPLGMYHQKFWQSLRALSNLDKKDWPKSIPNEVNHRHWEFCFDGHPIFVVCNTPAHVLRRSRYSSAFMMTFQPRWVFDNLLNTKEKAEREFNLVSNRLRPYDHVEKSPLLGQYGDLNKREADQYFLADRNVKMGCPFKRLNEAGDSEI